MSIRNRAARKITQDQVPTNQQGVIRVVLTENGNSNSELQSTWRVLCTDGCHGGSMSEKHSSGRWQASSHLVEYVLAWVSSSKYSRKSHQQPRTNIHENYQSLPATHIPPVLTYTCFLGHLLTVNMVQNSYPLPAFSRPHETVEKTGLGDCRLFFPKLCKV